MIPYTSIIEQNAKVFKDVLGNENVLEHHSNYQFDNKNSEDVQFVNEKLKLASENWDIQYFTVRKLLNVLYVTNPESYLARDGENILVRIDYEIKFRVPVHNLEGIVCFGYQGASPALLGLCAEPRRVCFWQDTCGVIRRRIRHF